MADSFMICDFSDVSDVKITYIPDGMEDFGLKGSVFAVENSLGTVRVCETIDEVIEHLVSLTRLTDLKVPYVR
jgi:hypothetical protein